MTNRAKALAWWREFTPQKQQELIRKYYPGSLIELISTSSSRIEEMYNKETNNK